MALLGLLAVLRGQSLDASLRSEGDVILLQLPNVDGESSAVALANIENIHRNVVCITYNLGTREHNSISWRISSQMIQMIFRYIILTKV